MPSKKKISFLKVLIGFENGIVEIIYYLGTSISGVCDRAVLKLIFPKPFGFCWWGFHLCSWDECSVARHRMWRNLLPEFVCSVMKL